MSDCDGGYNDDKKNVAERVIICTNVCESGDKDGKVFVCPDMNTAKCPKSKDFDESKLPKKGLVKLDHENLPPELRHISVEEVPLGGTWASG